MQITKREAYGPAGGHESSFAYPPRHTLEIFPPADVEKYQPLRVFLELNGTEDERKFALTSPPILSAQPMTKSSSQESEQSMWCHGSLAEGIFKISTEHHRIVCARPDINDRLILKIIEHISSDNYWLFGSHLGVPRNDLEFLRAPNAVSHASDVHKIFDFFYRSVEPARRTWKHILDALENVNEKNLANEILKELSGYQCIMTY